MEAASGLRVSFFCNKTFFNFRHMIFEHCDAIRIESNDHYWAHCRNPETFDFSVDVAERHYISAKATSADAFLTKAVEYLDAGHEIDRQSFFQVVARCINGGYLNAERGEELRNHFAVEEG